MFKEVTEIRTKERFGNEQRRAEEPVPVMKAPEGMTVEDADKLYDLMIAQYFAR